MQGDAIRLRPPPPPAWRHSSSAAFVGVPHLPRFGVTPASVSPPPCSEPPTCSLRPERPTWTLIQAEWREMKIFFAANLTLQHLLVLLVHRSVARLLRRACLCRQLSFLT